MRATVFELDPGEWRVVLSGQILPTIYDSRGSAVTGLETEQKKLLEQVGCITEGIE